MTMDSKSLRITLALAGTVAILIGGAVIFADLASADPDEDHSLDKLDDHGDRLGAVDGTRTDHRHIYQLEYYPASALMADRGDPTDGSERPVGPQTTVDTAEVYLSTVTTDSIERSVEVVYWSEVDDGNTTSADIVATDTQSVEFSEGVAMESIDLRDDLDDVRVTMWFSEDESVRWGFNYDPDPSAQPIDIETLGDFWTTAMMWLVLPALIGIVISGTVAKRAINRAGRGPGYPLFLWALVVGLGGLIAFFALFSSITELVDSIPFIVGVGIAVISLIVIVESIRSNEREIQFIRPRVESVESPDGDSESVDIVGIDSRSETVVDVGDIPAIVQTGISPFIARLFGATATVPRASLKTSIKNLSDSDPDEFLIVDPDSDQILDLDQEAMSIRSLGTIKDIGGIVAVGAFGSVAYASAGLIAGAILASLCALAIWVRPQNGSATVDPANVHVRSAWISTMVLDRDVADAKTLGDARDRIAELQAKNQTDIQSALEDQDATLIEEALGVDDFDRGVESDSKVGVALDDSDINVESDAEKVGVEVESRSLAEKIFGSDTEGSADD